MSFENTIDGNPWMLMVISPRDPNSFTLRLEPELLEKPINQNRNFQSQRIKRS
jgi:hypothetical protein